MSSEPKLSTLSIVFAGKLNPAIFHPEWFLARNLVSKEDVRLTGNGVRGGGSSLNPEDDEEDDQLFIFNSGASFSMTWVQVHVTEDNFTAMTTHTAFALELRDLVSQTFTILSQTPVFAMGINYEQHYDVGPAKSKSIFDKLSPQLPWDSCLPDSAITTIARRKILNDDPRHFLNLRIEQSVRYNGGLFIGINNHSQLYGSKEHTIGSTAAVNRLGEIWDQSSKQAKEIQQAILSMGDKP